MMMGRLPSCTARDVDRVLVRLGLITSHQQGSHRFYKSVATGKVVTAAPIHPGDLDRSLLKKIIKQVGLFEDEFRTLL
jgi:predicted RNA binding protein YcfA (HicA-like mRNA interferase family)